MNKRVIVLIIIVLIIIGAIVMLANPFKSEQSPFVTVSSSSEVGQKIADFELESFDGEKVRLSQFSGKHIFIDFWAGWCPFCVNEMPEIEKIHKEFGSPAGELVVLGIHRSETENVVTGTEFAKQRGVTYTLLKDTTGQVYRTLNGGRNFMPYALYINKQGTIMAIKAGPKTEEEMRREVKKLLQEDKGRQ